MGTETARPALVLHIGFPKCGSTALQGFMIRNQDALRRRGIVIADRNMRHPGPGRAGQVAQVLLGGLLRTGRDAAPTLEAALEALAERMRAFGDTTCVISSESLSNQDDYPALFRRARDLFDVTVIAYVRPQHDWLPSAWRQFGVRAGVPLEAFVDRHLRRGYPAFLPILDAWAAMFGAGRVIARPMRRTALVGGDLRVDFCARLGWPTEGLDLTAESMTANTSFDFDILSVLATAHGVLAGDRTTKVFGFLQTHLPDAALSAGRVPLSPDRQAEIHRTFLPTNRALQEKYFPDVPFEDAFGAPDGFAARNTSDTLPEATARTLAYMIAVAQSQDAEIRTLRRRLDRLERGGGRAGAAGDPAPRPPAQEGPRSPAPIPATTRR